MEEGKEPIAQFTEEEMHRLFVQVHSILDRVFFLYKVSGAFTELSFQHFLKDTRPFESFRPLTHFCIELYCKHCCGIMILNARKSI